jgi:Siphovirus ReqiPepy6 Gp37-like protein
MDIIRFHNPTSQMKMEDGEIINGLTSKMWIERYGKEGEFTLIGPVSKGIKTKLPIGSFITHVDSTEIMIVENHEINDDAGKATDIKITGRGFETFFENRIVGSNKTFPFVSSVTPIVDYSLDAADSWDQAVTLISDHILAANLLDDNNQLEYVTVLTRIGGSGTSVARTFPIDTLYNHILKLLAVDGCGIKVVRPGNWWPLNEGDPNTAVVIYQGQDKTQNVIFSFNSGEIISADYLWSNKNYKTAALVSGKWVQVFVSGGAEYNRRVMYVNGTDIDKDFSSTPTGADLTAVEAAMRQLGLEALLFQTNIALTKADISKSGVKSVYRKDFNVGDIVTVSGDYNESAAMRVSEYVETEDNTGESGYPTLSIY